MSKSLYLTASIKKTLSRRGLACPSCAAPNKSTPALDRKWLVTALRRCNSCKLLYRTPTTTEEESNAIYQNLYVQDHVTELPGETMLTDLIRTNFTGTVWDYTGYIKVLECLKIQRGARLFDFGCSWGYGSHQLSVAGFDTCAYEISQSRAKFASERLGVRQLEPEHAEGEAFDVFFSCHVLEHVPSVEQVIGLAERLLRRGGWFVAFTPNGSLERRKVEPEAWHRAWGFVHPQLLDREWIEARENNSLIADTTPFDFTAIALGQTAQKWTGSELLIAFRRI